ncbi:MAG: hypothetical protein EOP56_09215 [Sphingobacteriales bacterium]|nr:MAG: hypothetical protein EOP56_09215 [Sphingobacteriales bacterium]
MEKSQSIANLAKALLQFQGNMGKILKDESNPFFKSKYATLSNILENIQKPLAEAGLCFTQLPDGSDGLTSMLMHAESGEYLMATYAVHAEKNSPQAVGSAITYARRYALGAMLGLNIDDDDDGNAASQPAKQQVDPYTQKYKTVAEVEKVLKTCKTVQQLGNLFIANSAMVDGDAKLKDAFTEKKSDFSPIPKVAG